MPPLSTAAYFERGPHEFTRICNMNSTNFFPESELRHRALQPLQAVLQVLVLEGEPDPRQYTDPRLYGEYIRLGFYA